MSYNILDSSLITPTFLKKYNCKIINFGSYSHVYFYDTTKLKKEKNNINFVKPFIKRQQNYELKQVEIKNINRSKFNCQRIALANLDSWQTFITLTYSDNFVNISLSRKHFSYFIDKIRRVKKDFKYLCITEFQKRGAIHYHLLTNININDSTLLYLQEDNPKFKHIKYWNYGFNSVEFIKDNKNKIVGYISKYMTKDLDNRLFSKRRYLYSRNLITPKESYIDLSKDDEYIKFINYFKNSNVNFSYNYKDTYNNSNIYFIELENI